MGAPYASELLIYLNFYLLYAEKFCGEASRRRAIATKIVKANNDEPP
jgi:hypothetical protein